MPTKLSAVSKVSKKTAPGNSKGNGGEIHQYTDQASNALTTNSGVKISDNQNSLRAGTRGPTLLEDHLFLDKLMHFDRERIPERVVHARGAAAHGFFELTETLEKYTTAQVLTEVGKRIPVFARLSTVAGGQGSADTVRDVRGFAVKFYTEQGNWDLVGNNIPVFFIQDAIKFPDLVHAVKREPDRGYPTSSTAHDTFWDFISLMPEAIHMIMWIMSDRTIPRALSMMEGFGVHTFKLINRDGQATFVKYHWRPKLGVQSLIWDEAVKIAGADPDFHRRNLWEAINAGKHPEWELAVQLFTEKDIADWPFDPLDATKLIPEELIPLKKIGRMVLNRNPDNFFSENEQSAFCPSRILPGMDFSADPLLQGRIFSYADTQMHRLGSANFQQLPINRPRCPVMNFQRDGFGQFNLQTGRIAYEPSELNVQSPRAHQDGFKSHAETLQDAEKLRIRSASFSDHYSQARQFFLSQTDIEQAHITDTLVFELSKVTTPVIRGRIVAHLRNIDETLAHNVAQGLGLESVPNPVEPTQTIQTLPPSPPLSILHQAKPTLEGRCIGILLDHGSDAIQLKKFSEAISKANADIKYIAPVISDITLSNKNHQPIDGQLAGMPSVFFDAVVILLTPSSAQQLSKDPAALNFVRDAFHHCKAIAIDQGGQQLLMAAQIKPDDFVIASNHISEFLTAATNRYWARQQHKQ